MKFFLKKVAIFYIIIQTVLTKLKDLHALGIIVLISFIFCLDLFLIPGEPATFDGPTHVTQMALFYQGLLDGDFPVVWGDGFANYGMPMPLIAQQLPCYVGALLNFIFQDFIFSYKLVVWLATLLAGASFYYLARYYTNVGSGLLGSIFYMLAPYKILNIYVRGALPEYMALVFLPLMWLGIEYIFSERKFKGGLLLFAGLLGTLLTHPMMIIIYLLSLSCLVALRLFKFFKQNYKNKKNIFIKIFQLILPGLLALGISAYYVVPLFLEMKFFYYGRYGHNFKEGQFLDVINFLQERWQYFGNGTFTRDHTINLGLPELIMFLFGLGLSIFILVKKNLIKNNLLILILTLINVVYIFMLLPGSQFFYKNISLLGAIQYPWRMMAGLSFVIALLFAVILEKIPKKFMFLGILFLIWVMWLRFPQLYGKNYILFPQSHYSHTLENLHGDVLNTVWTGKTHTYPVKNQQAEIIEGAGKIKIIAVKNSFREYSVNSKNGVRLADYTFYFPGWRVFVDGVEAEIQFQDPAYRGVITYQVPAGEHEIIVKFTDTKIRLLGKILSILSIILAFVYFKFFAKLKHDPLGTITNK